MYAQLGGLFLIILVLITSFEHYIGKILRETNMISSERLSEEYQIKHYISLLRIIENARVESYSSDKLLITYLVYHRYKCKLTKCPLSSVSFQGNQMTETKETRIDAIKRAIAIHFQILTSHMDSLHLKIFYVSYLAIYMKSYVTAWAMIDSMFRLDSNIIQQFHIYVFKYQPFFLFPLENSSEIKPI